MYSEDDVMQFVGGWSYTQNEIRDFLKHITSRETYNVLEFGSGNSTRILYDILERYCQTITYDTYETDETYRVVHKNVNTILYDSNQIDQLIIPNKIYDIILIDGPNGVLRSKWYSKIRNHVAYHTIMLIDDYNHYTEFEAELNKNYSYIVLSLSDEPFRPYGEHSWRIITHITLKDI
jgi:hypothetical protein